MLSRDFGEGMWAIDWVPVKALGTYLGTVPEAEERRSGES